MEEQQDIDIELETTDAEGSPLEDTELEAAEESALNKQKQLRQKLKACEQEKMSALEDLQRVRADFLNARKRLDEERVNDRERLRVQFIEDLLPLCDSFAMALADRSFQELPADLQKGILGINMQLSSVLKDYQIMEIGEIGENFDPNLHEALSDNGGGHTISQVIQKGYKMGDRLIRPAKVVVG